MNTPEKGKQTVSVSSAPKPGFDSVASLVAQLLDGATVNGTVNGTAPTQLRPESSSTQHPSFQAAQSSWAAAPLKPMGEALPASPPPMIHSTNGAGETGHQEIPKQSAAKQEAPKQEVSKNEVSKNGEVNHNEKPWVTETSSFAGRTQALPEVPAPNLAPPWLRDSAVIVKPNQTAQSIAQQPTPLPSSLASPTGLPVASSTFTPASTTAQVSPPVFQSQEGRQQSPYQPSPFPSQPLGMPASPTSVPLQASAQSPIPPNVSATLQSIFAPTPTQPASQPASLASTLPEQPTLSATNEIALEPGSFQSDGNAIHIKGRGDGITLEIGRGVWEVLLIGLKQRLESSGSFFRGANVAIDLGERSLSQAELQTLCDTLVAFQLKPGLVRTSSDRTFQVALGLGLASTLQSKDGTPIEMIQSASSNQEQMHHFVYRGALRAGQILKRRSHILIIGDVNPGAEVIASGDILVWGRLRGAAHAGAEGDQKSVVAAFDIDPVQLRIADIVAMGEGAQQESSYRWFWQRGQSKPPEIARLINGSIVIEPWDEAKSAGSPVLKRRR